MGFVSLPFQRPQAVKGALLGQEHEKSQRQDVRLHQPLGSLNAGLRKVAFIMGAQRGFASEET